MPLGTIFTGIKIFGFIGKGFNFVGSMLAKLLEVAVKYPLQALGILIFAIAAYFMYDYVSDLKATIAGHVEIIEEQHTKIAELNEQLGEFQLQASERGLKIAALEESSKAAGEQAKRDLQEANKQFASTVNSYEKKLADAKANPTIKFQTIYVEVPGKTGPIQVDFEDGVQVCKQYPSGYAQTVNELVRTANDTLKGVAK